MKNVVKTDKAPGAIGHIAKELMLVICISFQDKFH